jgi:uncharacterized protein (TIGR03085 family)
VSYLAADERAALCDLALEVGEEAPTLCEGWDVKDLVVHLLVREGHPAAVGIVVPPLAPLVDAASRRMREKDFAGLVERLRTGPPVYSPMALPNADKLLNGVELFVHHEDVRRAQPGWAPRPLSDRTQKALWKALGRAGKATLRKAPTGVVAERTDTGERAVLKPGDPEVVVHGLPAEVMMFAFGRPEADVKLTGDPDAVDALTRSTRGY